jgi:N-acetyl-alpha-D-glucosaminyl L-malate synthase BshA
VNIAMLCHASLGGSSRVATRLAYALEGRGHDVALVSASPPPAPAKELTAVELAPFTSHRSSEWTTVIHSTWNARRLAALERHLAALVRRNAVDVLHYHYAWPFAHVVRPLRARLGGLMPLVVATLHGTDVTHPPDGTDLGLLQEVDVVTTVSESHAAVASDRLELWSTPTVIPNFVELGDFPASTDFADPASARSRPRIVHVSNFRPVKDPEGIARIFVAIRRSISAELWLVGAGPGLAAAVSYLQRAGLGDDVRTLGYRADVGNVLRDCDLLLMASREESFCLAALEGMASGLTLVGTSVGGLRELARHGHTALLFEPGAYEQGAEHAVRALTDHALRLRLRAAARARARRFSSHVAVEQYEKLYADALSARPSARRVASGAR